MKKIVRNKKTGLFLAANGTWTSRSQQAQPFDSVLQAIDRINQLLLRDCEIVFKAGDAKYDLVLPITPVSPLPGFSRATQRALEQV